MKFVVDSTVFARTIKKHVKIAKPNKDKPILSNIKIETQNSKVKVISYDGVTSHITFLSNVKIDEPGEILVNASNINRILSQYPSKTKLTLLTENNTLSLKCTGIDNKIAFEDKAHEYPEVEVSKPDVTLEINADILLDSLKKVASYVDEKPEKILFECITINIKDGSTLQAYVTTLSKYAQVEFDIDPVGDDYVFTIFSKDIDKVMALLKETSNSITIGLTDKDIIFKVNGDYMTLRKVDVTPIPFDSLLNRMQFSTEIKVKVDDLLQSINRALAVFCENTKVCLSVRKNNIKITGQDKAGNKVNETVASEMICGDNIKIFLNPMFLQFMLRGFEDEFINMLFQTKLTPILFKNEDENEKYILCPLNPGVDNEDDEDEKETKVKKPKKEPKKKEVKEKVEEDTKDNAEIETTNDEEQVNEKPINVPNEVQINEDKDEEKESINEPINETKEEEPTEELNQIEETEEPIDENKYKEINYDSFDEYEYTPNEYVEYKEEENSSYMNMSDMVDDF